MGKRKYFLDLNDLQYKQVRHSLGKRFLHFLFWFSGSAAITMFYVVMFQNSFGSPKERLLNQQIDNIKLEYSIANRELDLSMRAIKSLKMSDEIRYRPVLKMDSIPWSIRNPGFGGTERFRDLDGYKFSYLMKSTRERIEEMKNMANVQNESFITIKDKSEEWQFEMDHLPAISPVDPSFRLGDRFGFREKHPILGYGRMHYGQDFEVPYNTKVYATGDGKVVESGFNTGGFGNYVVIDHGFGLVSIYAHLSSINVPKDINVKRGDLVGLSGSTGSLSTGPHLHYEIKKYGSPINAINFFNNDITQEEFNEMIQAFGSNSIFR
ncbi:MAG: M23 family metallopeptidase [Bacteroidia bacterium]|nr:M23 family metallopeptidase [Bacteroidia bacterium]